MRAHTKPVLTLVVISLGLSGLTCTTPISVQTHQQSIVVNRPSIDNTIANLQTGDLRVVDRIIDGSMKDNQLKGRINGYDLTINVQSKAGKESKPRFRFEFDNRITIYGGTPFVNVSQQEYTWKPLGELPSDAQDYVNQIIARNKRPYEPI